MDDRGDVLAALEREQRDAIGLWRSLTESEWARPSLCRGWTVKDVLVHVIKGEQELFQKNLPRSIAGDASAPNGFGPNSLEEINDTQIAEHRHRPAADLIAEAEDILAATRTMLGEITDEEWRRPAWNPITPGTVGFYVKGRIWEWWVHNQDIRVPLKRLGGTEDSRTTPVVEVIRDGIPGAFLPEKAKGVRVSYAFQVGRTGFTIRIDDGTIKVEPSFDPKATSRIKADPATFILVGTQRIPQMRAVLTRKFKPSGNPFAGLKFISYFRQV